MNKVIVPLIVRDISCPFQNSGIAPVFLDNPAKSGTVGTSVTLPSLDSALSLDELAERADRMAEAGSASTTVSIVASVSETLDCEINRHRLTWPISRGSFKLSLPHLLGAILLASGRRHQRLKILSHSSAGTISASATLLRNADHLALGWETVGLGTDGSTSPWQPL